MNGIQRNTDDGPPGETFGQAMRRLRAKQHLSLGDLVLTANVSKGHLSNLEHDQRSPSEEIARAIDGALNADGALLALAAPPAHPTARTDRPRGVRPAQLPAVSHGFVGRADEIDHAAQLVRDGARVLVFDGPAGVGKTALAVRWAHERASEFPDGVLFTDLRGFAGDGQPEDPRVVLGRLLASLGVAPGDVPHDIEEREALFRSMLKGTRTLLVLDNAADADQVRPLLPGSPSCLTLVTSRSTLADLAVHNGAVRVTLDVMSPGDADALLRTVLGERLDDAPHPAATIARHCGMLPLTLRIAAERANTLRDLPLAELAAQLATASDRLDVLVVGRCRAVRSVLSWSYTTLPPPAARMFRLLGLSPTGAITVEAAAALAGCAWPESRAALEDLAAIHLIEHAAGAAFAMHDLVGLYAAELAEQTDGREQCRAAVRRLVDFYLRTGATATRLLWPTRPRRELPAPEPAVTPLQFATPSAAVRWFAAELHTLSRVVRRGAKWGVDIAAHLPVVISEMLFHRRAWSWWVPALQDALATARATRNRDVEAWLLEILGDAALDDYDADAALAAFRDSHWIRRDLGDLGGQAACHVGIARAHHLLGNYTKAVDHCEKAQALCAQVGDQWEEAVAVAHLAAAQAALGNLDQARTLLETVRDIFLATGDLMSQGCASMMLASMAEAHDQPDDARVHLEEALHAYTTVGDVWSQAHIHGRIGDLEADRDNLDAAHRSWSTAAELLNDNAEPAAIELRQQLIASLKETS